MAMEVGAWALAACRQRGERYGVGAAAAEVRWATQAGGKVRRCREYRAEGWELGVLSA